MIFQFLQNILHLNSTNMHIFFIVLMVLYVGLQIIDMEKVWAFNNKESDKGKIASKSNFMLSVLISIILGLGAWMLTMDVVTFLPEEIIGKAAFGGKWGRELGNTGYQFFLAVSFLGVIPVILGGFYLAGLVTFECGLRFSFAVLAGSVIPFYSFIYSIMPVNTEILFGLAALSEIVLLLIGLILELIYGGRFGFIRGLLEYTVSFAFFTSLLTFPKITRSFFGVLGFVIVLIAAAVFLYERFSDSGEIDLGDPWAELRMLSEFELRNRGRNKIIDGNTEIYVDPDGTPREARDPYGYYTMKENDWFNNQNGAILTQEDLWNKKLDRH